MMRYDPFGPVETYDGLIPVTFELSWQCAKLYPNYVINDCVDANLDPAPGYFAWRDNFWAKHYPEDFPAMKKNAYARGFTKAAWMRLPLIEKFAILKG